MFKEAEQLFCRYADDGNGLPKENLIKGLGLQSIESRVNTFDGKIQFDSSTNTGFSAQIVIPLPSHRK